MQNPRTNYTCVGGCSATGMEHELLAPAKVELAVEALTWAAMSKATSQDISKFDYIILYISIVIYQWFVFLLSIWFV